MTIQETIGIAIMCGVPAGALIGLVAIIVSSEIRKRKQSR